MFKRYWSVILAAALGFIAVGGGVGFGLSRQASDADRAYNQAAYYAKNAADKEAKTCLQLTRIEQSQCLRQKAKEHRLASRDKQREYEDLVAQQKSALWTMIMGIAALIGMGLSVVGVVLVWTTFRETRRSADAAHEANRPWLKIEVIENDGLSLDNDNAELTAKIKVTNVGKSPALHVNICAVLHADRGVPGVVIRAAADKAIEWLVSPELMMNQKIGATIFPGGETSEDYIARGSWIADPDKSQSFFMSLGVGVIYMFGTEIGETIAGYEIWPLGKSRQSIEVPTEPNHSHLHNVVLLDNLSGHAC